MTPKPLAYLLIGSAAFSQACAEDVVKATARNSTSQAIVSIQTKAFKETCYATPEISIPPGESFTFDPICIAGETDFVVTLADGKVLRGFAYLEAPIPGSGWMTEVDIEVLDDQLEIKIEY